MTRGWNTSIDEPFEDPESQFRRRKNQKNQKEVQHPIQTIMTIGTNPSSQSSGTPAAGENVDPTGYTFGQDKPKTQTDYDSSTMPTFEKVTHSPFDKPKSSTNTNTPTNTPTSNNIHQKPIKL